MNISACVKRVNSSILKIRIFGRADSGLAIVYALEYLLEANTH